MSTTTVTIATMHTGHFSFTAAGATVPLAKKALVAAWAEHRSQFSQEIIERGRMPKANFAALNAVFEISVDTLKLGQGYRDGTQITK